MDSSSKLAPGAGLEPATSKLTASCSTIELPGITEYIIPYIIFLSNLILDYYNVKYGRFGARDWT